MPDEGAAGALVEVFGRKFFACQGAFERRLHTRALRADLQDRFAHELRRVDGEHLKLPALDGGAHPIAIGGEQDHGRGLKQFLQVLAFASQCFFGSLALLNAVNGAHNRFDGAVGIEHQHHRIADPVVTAVFELAAQFDREVCGIAPCVCNGLPHRGLKPGKVARMKLLENLSQAFVARLFV